MPTTTQQRLDEAEIALHKLRIGAAAVSFGYGDQQATYTKAELGDLKRYVAELKAQLSGRGVVRNRVRYGVPD